MGVVEGRAQHLAAGHVLEGGRDAPPHRHPAGVDRQAGGEARQGGAVGAQQEDRLDHVAARLLDRERRQLRIVERAFAHHPGDAEAQLLLDLRAASAPARLGSPRRSSASKLVRRRDRPLAAFDGYIHGSSLRFDRG